MALAVPLSRFTSQVGGGSAFFVRRHYAHRMNNDAFYDEVARELQAKEMVPGVWTRAFAEADGQIERARALYIKYRVAQMSEARSQQIQEQRQMAAVAARKRAASRMRRFGYLVLTGICVFLVLIFGLGIFIPFSDHSAGAIIGALFMVGIAVLFGLAAYASHKAYKNER